MLMKKLKKVLLHLEGNQLIIVSTNISRKPFAKINRQHFSIKYFLTLHS